MAEGLCQLFVLLDLADEVHTHVGRALEPFGLTRATFQALWHLSSDGAQTHKAMANRAGCAPSNVTRLVDRLEKLGFVERTAMPDDRRVVLTKLTPEGRVALQGASEALGTVQNALIPRLTHAEQRCGEADL